MAGSLREMVEQAKKGKYDERLRAVVGTYRFDVDEVGSYRIEVDHGQISVREDPDRSPADCVIASSEQDCVRLFSGDQNMLTAYMQGRARVSGDMALAAVFAGYLPGPRQRPQEGDAR